MIYLDNAATSFPKPDRVIETVTRLMSEGVASPGRGNYSLAARANDAFVHIRRHMARFFGVSDEFRIVFSYSATDALNLAIKGFLQDGDHAIISSMEHNSVVRPLKRLEQQGVISLDVVKCSKQGYLDPKDVFKCFKPTTKLAVISHASNVTGAVQPISAIGKGVRERGAYLLVDAAQTVGILPTNLMELNADMLAFAGHKGLYGLQGTGGLVIGDRVKRLQSYREGGTGYNSESEYQPVNWPEAFEAGTPNVPGIVSMGEGLAFIEEVGLDNIFKTEQEHLSEIWDGLRKIKGIRLYGPEPDKNRVAVLSFSLPGWDVDDLGQILNNNFGIQVRTGLHCSPLAHRTIGSGSSGTVRVSPGYYTSLKDIKEFLKAIKVISATQVYVL